MRKTLSGSVELAGLPANFGLIVDLAFFAVPGPDSAPPYGGDPPADAVTDTASLLNDANLETERLDASRVIPFSLQHAPGYFYLELRVVLFRKQAGKIFAQAEQFFVRRRPFPLLDDVAGVALPVEWPSTPLNELGSYGTIKPEGAAKPQVPAKLQGAARRPWWQFW